MWKKRKLVLSCIGLGLLLVLLAVSVDKVVNITVQGLNPNTYAPTPSIPAAPIMGFDPWPTYVDNNNILNESYYMQAANVMHNEKFPIWDGTEQTMQQVGYTYETIDDDWGGKRTSAGLQPNLVYFPHLLNPDPNTGLIAHVHELGLRVGLYTSVGTVTCFNSPQGPIPGSLGYEAVDGAEFQKWGVNYMKLDWCGDGRSYSPSWVESDLKKWRQDLGPNIGIATNTGGAGNPWEYAAQDNTVNAWRIAQSMRDWRLGAEGTGQWNGGPGSVLAILDNSHLQQSHASAGHWSDGGYLHTGVNLTLNQSKSEFSMWAMITSPLIVGADILKMKPGDITSQVIFNTEIIAVDQDPLIVQATPKAIINGVEVWEKPLSNNSYAVAFLNENNSTASASVTWSQVGIPTSSMPSEGYYVRDLWAHADMGQFAKGFSATNIPANGITVIKVSTSSANLLPPVRSTSKATLTQTSVIALTPAQKATSRYFLVSRPPAARLKTEQATRDAVDPHSVLVPGGSENISASDSLHEGTCSAADSYTTQSCCYKSP